LTSLEKGFPFSYAFGPADSREACIDSAQRVYNRLMLRTPDEPVLQFMDIIAMIAVEEDVESDSGDIIDQVKAKDLVKLFRPDRQGRLTMLDFVRSTDAVYKELRLLQASIENSSQIDHAFENIINLFFYVIAFVILLAALGL